MKSTFLFLLISLSFNSFAADFFGGQLMDSKTKEQIGLRCEVQDADGCYEASFILDDTQLNEGFIIPMGISTDEYQERAYAFLAITQTASTSRYMVPYARYLFNMRKVNKQLREAFQLMIDPTTKNKQVKMSHKNFIQVIQAIREN